MAIDWVFTDLGHTFRTKFSHGVLIPDVAPQLGTADLTVTATKADLWGLIGGTRGLEGLLTEATRRSW